METDFDRNVPNMEEGSLVPFRKKEFDQETLVFQFAIDVIVFL